MSFELYFYRCKKHYYEQHANDLIALSREALSADWRWLNLASAEQNLTLMDPPENIIDASRCPKESDNIISVDGWAEHTGAVFNWLSEYTRLAVASNFPVILSYQTITALYKVCQEVVNGQHVGSWFFSETDEPIEELHEGFLQTLHILDKLLSTIDFETEVVLLQTNW